MNSIKLAATIVLSFALVFLLFDGGDPSIEGETRAEVPEVSSEGAEQALVQPDGDPEDRTMAGEASSGASSSESGDQIAVISGRVLPPLEGAPRLDRVVVVGWRRNPDGPGREHFETRCDALGKFEFSPGPTSLYLDAGGGGIASLRTGRMGTPRSAQAGEPVELQCEWAYGCRLLLTDEYSGAPIPVPEDTLRYRLRSAETSQSNQFYGGSYIAKLNGWTVAPQVDGNVTEVHVVCFFPGLLAPKARLSVTSQGYDDYEQDLEMIPGERVDVTVSLRPKRGHSNVEILLGPAASALAAGNNRHLVSVLGRGGELQLTAAEAKVAEDGRVTLIFDGWPVGTSTAFFEYTDERIVFPICMESGANELTVSSDGASFVGEVESAAGWFELEVKDQTGTPYRGPLVVDVGVEAAAGFYRSHVYHRFHQPPYRLALGKRDAYAGEVYIPKEGITLPPTFPLVDGEYKWFEPQYRGGTVYLDVEVATD